MDTFNQWTYFCLTLETNKAQNSLSVHWEKLQLKDGSYGMRGGCSIIQTFLVQPSSSLRAPVSAVSRDIPVDPAAVALWLLSILFLQRFISAVHPGSLWCRLASVHAAKLLLGSLAQVRMKILIFVSQWRTITNHKHTYCSCWRAGASVTWLLQLNLKLTEFNIPDTKIGVMG